jgi:hypothetical protein
VGDGLGLAVGLGEGLAVGRRRLLGATTTAGDNSQHRKAEEEWGELV